MPLPIKIRIRHDGNGDPMQTIIEDAETGARLSMVTAVDISIAQDKFIATLQLERLAMDIIAEPNFVMNIDDLTRIANDMGYRLTSL